MARACAGQVVGDRLRGLRRQAIDPARRNQLLGRDLLSITDVERQVLELAPLGHANKHIAYELGLAPSTVAAKSASGACSGSGSSDAPS